MISVEFLTQQRTNAMLEISIIIRVASYVQIGLALMLNKLYCIYVIHAYNIYHLIYLFSIQNSGIAYARLLVNVISKPSYGFHRNTTNCSVCTHGHQVPM